jgi:hypothetical protein
MGTIEKYLKVTSVLDTCIAVSKRAAFVICVKGRGVGGGALGCVYESVKDGVFIV